VRRSNRLRIRLLALSGLVAVAVTPAFAAEPVPGDACTTLNYIIETGGPETTGVRHLLRCDGTVWQQEMTIDTDGSVTLGSTVIGSSGSTYANLQDDGWGNTYVASTRSDGLGAIYFNLGTANSTGDARFVISGTDRLVSSVIPFAAESAFQLKGDLTPPQITANKNNYSPTGLADASVLRLSSDASRNITSLAGGTEGRVITIMNVGSFPIVLKNDDGATGTAANRFALTGDLTLAAKQSAMLMYDSTASRWRQIANGTATGSGDNLGSHTATQNIVLGSYWLSGDGGNEGIQVDGSGNVGINTAPVSGTRLSMADSGGGVSEIATLTNTSAASAGTGVGIVYGGPSSIKLGGIGAMWEDGTGNNSGLYFSTRNTSYTPKMYLSAAGNLGIGTVGVPGATLDVNGSVAWSGDISPAQITANQNDYNPAGLSTASVLRLNSNASRNITSLAGGADGRVLTVMNIGSNAIVLKNDDGATGTAANRFALTGDLTLAAKQSAMLMYDSTASRWRQIANGTATGSGDNLGNHTATQNITLGSNYLSGDGGNEGINIDGNGHVFIGQPATADDAALSITGATYAGDVNIIYAHAESDNNGAGIKIANDSAVSHQAQLNLQNIWFVGNSLGMNTTDDFYIYNSATGSSPFYIGTNNKIGIGTAAPADSLHVYEATPGESAGITIGNDGTGVSQQSWLNLVTKGDGSHALATSGVQGWQIWANADASTTLGYSGGANGFGIGYTDGSSWNAAALVIQPTDRLGIFNPYPGAGLDAGTSVAFSGDISPAQITADKNNYDPTDLAKASVLRLTSDASRTITGLAGGVDGRVLTILNVGSNPIVLSNQNTSSTAGNRFAIGANLTISADQSASLIYDSTSQRWRSAGLPFESSGLAGPAGCANIGDLCADGTVFAGWNPVTQDQLFIPTTDQGTTSKWKTSTGTNDIATDSTDDGRANTNQVANTTTFPAFKLCKDLGAGSHNDWYLPSQVELYYLWSVRGAIEAGNHITNFQNTYYWSSTEYNTTDAWYQYFAGGVGFTSSKTGSYRVRCVRR